MLIRLNQAQPYVLSLFRFVVGLLFAFHGAASLFGVLGGSQAETGAWPGWYAALIQLVCGALVALGLGTRAAAFLASGSMAYAYFKVHQPEAFLPLQNGGEPSAMFCWAFLLLVFTGPGAVALDRFFGSRSTGTAATAEDTTRQDKAPAVSV
ncbi:DoxX family protein [Streptomyces rubiginosohelvolus]|uniref:DoxX family protein n=1 Tax=Streptomyces rubiginosohelvolus TaxID=67362 RepID=UPI0036F726AA